MALTATIYHFQIDFSDVDRGVYEALDLRLARHPSETIRYLLTRAIAYCLCYEEGIQFSKGGLSNADEPALCVRDQQGNLAAWIEIGSPSAERLHKASKASPRLVLFTHNDPELIKRAAREREIFRAEAIEVYALKPEFLDELSGVMERNTRFALVHTEGQLYVTVAGMSVVGAVARHDLLSG